jgi:transposase-like protein
MAKRAKRDFDALQKRRMRAANMLRRGVPQAEVARRVGVSAAAVCKWNRVLEANGPTGLRKAGRAGRKPKLDAVGLTRLRERLKRSLPDTVPICGGSSGWANSSSKSAGCGTRNPGSGTCSRTWAFPASARARARSSAMSKRLRTGSERLGRG